MNKIGYIIPFCILTFIFSSHSEPTYTEYSKPIKPLEHDTQLETIDSIKPIDILEHETIETADSEINTIEIDPAEKELLACVIYQEAGSDLQCDECRRRVADVVLNRVESDLFPNTIYEVLTQQYQYGLYYYTGVVWPERASNPNEAEAVERAYRIAEEVLKGEHSDIYGKDYIWQAEFSQGINNIKCCGTYFGQLDKEV
jgi:spore germination cell wall hydrolase CwlJ-like protein